MENIVSNVLPLAFLVFGFVWTAAFITIVVRRRSFLKSALETTGTIIDVDVKHYRPKNFGSPGATHHYPTVRFTTLDGSVVDCRVNMSFGERYEIGQSVTVNYDPSNPCKRTQLGDRRSQPIGTSALFIGVGFVIFLIGLFLTSYFFF